MGRAQKKGLLRCQVVNIRDFATGKHQRVDDSPYGGGPGMVFRPDVLYRAWRSVVPRKNKNTITIYLSPQGQLLTQDMGKALYAKAYRKIVMICGHYEGIDQRFIDRCVDQEISIGNYILTGGEWPALVFADVYSRFIPGVVGKEESVQFDSLENGLLKYPQYTRPDTFMGVTVPEVLTSGNHQAIQKWRDQQSLEVTRQKRPDLLVKK